MSDSIVRYTNYRWVVLGIAWLAVMCLNWSWFLLSSLAHSLFPDLNLSHHQFTLIFTAPILISIVTSIPGGALADRYGIRLIVSIGIVTAGILGVARGFAPTFEGMFLLMCLFGIPFGCILPNLPKLVGIWFPPKQVGIASGIYMSAMGIGGAFGLFTGPLFQGWKTAFIYVGLLMLVIALLWALFARNAPIGMEVRMPPIVSGLKKGMKSRNIWLLATALGLYLGGFLGFSGNFPKALEGVHHISPTAAGIISSLITWGMVAGNLIFPSLSDRIGYRKPFLFVGSVASAGFFFLAWYLAPGIATWILIFLGGLLLGGVPPILYTILVELPEIGHEYVGGASGLASTLMTIGGFILPLAVISPFMEAGTWSACTNGFLVTAVLLAAIALLTIFMVETGSAIKAANK